MDNKQLETSGSKKPRVSKGKLKKSKRKCKTSQGFSSSFTQKTLHNNTLLAQSLAKEKSRNEKLLGLHRELITSRNEALMRLNETEASFDRLGAFVQKGIKQMQEVASTMGDMFAEIRSSKNNPRNSASMRSSWDETVSTAGRTMMKQPVCYMNGMEENVAVNDQLSHWPLPSRSLPVSPIEEELETSCSDDDTIRENSLICRRASTPWQPTDILPGEGASAQDIDSELRPHRWIRKVQRGMVKLPGHDFSSASWSEEFDVNNRTSLSLVDMDETVVQEEPTPSARNADTPRGNLLSFNTETGERVNEDLSYEDVFCGPPNNDASRTVAKTNALPVPTAGVGGARRSTTPPCFPDAGHVPSNREGPDSTGSPDFLGFSDDNIDGSNRHTPYSDTSSSPEEESPIIQHTPDFFLLTTVKSSSPKKHLCTKPPNNMSSTTQSSVLGMSSDDDAISQKKIHNKSPKLPQKQSKSSNVDHPNTISPKVKASSTSFSLSGNVLCLNSTKTPVLTAKQSQPKLSKHTDPNLVIANASKAKSPSLSKSTKIQHVINLEDSNTADHHSELSKSSQSMLKHSTLTGKSDISTKPDARDSPMITSLNTSLSIRSVEVSSETSTDIPEHTQPPTLVRTKSTQNKSKKIRDENEIIDPPLLTEPSSASATGTKRANGGLALDTPAQGVPVETRSADERGPRVPTAGSTWRSAEVPGGTRPIAGRRRNTEDADRPTKRPQSWRRLKRDLALAAAEAHDTPTRGPKAKTPKVVALLDVMEDKPRGSRESLASEQDSTERRTRRRIAQANYKEPSLNAKIRRPV